MEQLTFRIGMTRVRVTLSARDRGWVDITSARPINRTAALRAVRRAGFSLPPHSGEIHEGFMPELLLASDLVAGRRHRWALRLS